MLFEEHIGLSVQGKLPQVSIIDENSASLTIFRSQKNILEKSVYTLFLCPMNRITTFFSSMYIS